jgi:hypothetical protein
MCAAVLLLSYTYLWCGAQLSTGTNLPYLYLFTFFKELFSWYMSLISILFLWLHVYPTWLILQWSTTFLKETDTWFHKWMLSLHSHTSLQCKGWWFIGIPASHVNLSFQEFRSVRDELLRQKAQLASRVREREAELTKLRSQLSQRPSSPADDELESRLHALTQTLVVKQSSLETVTTEKNALRLQLEKIEVTELYLDWLL